MPQYLVANYLPDDFDPSAVTEAMIDEIHALNREMIAAGARKFACGISPAPATQRRCGSSLMVRCSSPMGHTPRPRSIWAVAGYWKLPIWTRRWRGRARVPSHAMRRARGASFYSSRLRRKQRRDSGNTAGLDRTPKGVCKFQPRATPWVATLIVGRNSERVRKTES